MRRVTLALRKTGWTVLCSVAVALAPVAVTPALAAQHTKKPAKTAKAGKVTSKSPRAAASVKKKRPASTVAKSKSRHRMVASAGKGHRGRAARRFTAAPARVTLAPAAARHDENTASRLPVGDQLGLRETSDPLGLQASVALVLDQDTNQVLFNKNDQAVLPIASVTKLMTGLLISESKLPLDQPITITQDDVDTEKHSRSRLAVGTTLTRGEMLHLALMSSENRAAHALGRTYPGGLERFVAAMNARAAMLGMKDTHYVEPTGLSSDNRSSASDLAKLVAVASQDPLLRELTTSPGYEIASGRRVLQYNNSNRLVKNPSWDIGLQKTGYINEAGQCLVMQTRIAGHQLIMVFLDSFNRLADAERVRRWIEARAQTDATRVGQEGTRRAG